MKCEKCNMNKKIVAKLGKIRFLSCGHFKSKKSKSK